MRVLMTGGTGYLGSHLAERLAAQGHELYAISRRAPGQTRTGAVHLQADISRPDDVAAIREKIGPIGLLVHMAAKVPKRSCEDASSYMISANIGGTANVLTAFANGLEQIIYGSTVEIYGLVGSTGPITEQQLPSPHSNYGASKLAGEHICRIFCEQRGLRYQVLRFSVMYGKPDPINRAIPNFIRNAKAGAPIEVYGGEELRDYLHVDDAAEAVCCAANAQDSGIYNIGSGKAITVRRAAQLIIDRTGSSSDLVIRPRQKQRADLILDISAARTGLGFEPSCFFPARIEQQLSQ